MRCTYCRHEAGDGVLPHLSPTHKAECPDAPGLAPEEAKKRRDAFWIGYKEGQILVEPDPRDKDHPQYMMGFGEGIVTLEERENGYNPYGPGGDPGPWG